MGHGREWTARYAGGLAALLLLAHCGGVEKEEAARALSVTEQAVATTLTFGASADARVEQAFPTRNFGGESVLLADLSPRSESYLRFSVSGATGKVTRATLRLFASDGTPDGPRVFSAAGGWSEGGITWNTRPPLSGAALDDKGSIPHQSWVEFDVTRAVRGNGEYNFAIIPTSSNGTDFYSRESSRTAMRSQLVLTVEGLPAECMPRTATFSRLVPPSRDEFVSQSEPTRGFSQEPVLRVDSSPRLESFLLFSFDLPEETSLRAAALRLRATDSTSNGPVLFRTSADWPSEELTWNTRPALQGSSVGNLGSISANTWVEYDVTGALGGDPSSTLHGFGLLPESSDGVDFVSQDSAEEALHPHLALTLETAPFCTYRGTGGGLTGWVRQSGVMGSELLQALATDSGGGVVVAGRAGDASSPAGTGFVLARLTADGTPLWIRQVTTGDVRVRAITVAPQGHILAVGDYSGSPDLGSGPLPTGPASRALFIAKFTATGQTEWSHGFVATFDRQGELEFWPLIPNAVATDAQGSLVVGGRLQGQVDFGGGPIFAGSDSVDVLEAQEGGFVAKFNSDGRHVWSRAFEAGLRDAAVRVSTVATDRMGRVLVGGRANTKTNLGNGPVGELVPFIAKYEAVSGALLWSRLFSGARSGNVESVQVLGADTVAFAANLGGVFTFGGRTFTVATDVADDHTEGFVGTLSATGADGWIRELEALTVQQLVTGSDGTITLTGHDGEVDLGGGTLGTRSLTSPFVVRYSSEGAHLWSRHFDPNFFDADVLPFFDIPRLRLASQPGGSVVVGGSFMDSILLDGRTFTAEGSSDALLLQLEP